MLQITQLKLQMGNYLLICYMPLLYLRLIILQTLYASILVAEVYGRVAAKDVDLRCEMLVEL